MTSAELLKRFAAEIESRPVPGASDVHVLHSKVQPPATAEEDKLTEADWDKFEADINEAFEQVP